MYQRFVRLWQACVKTIRHDIAVLTPLRILEICAIFFIIAQCVLMITNGVRGNLPIVGLKFEGKTIGHWRASDYQQQVNALVRARQEAKMELRVGDYRTTVTLRQIGEEVDLRRLYSVIQDTGRASSTFRNMIDQNRAASGFYQFPSNAIAQPNMSKMNAFLDALNTKVDVKPQNAYLTYKNQAVTIEAEKPGKTIDRQAALERIRNADPTVARRIDIPTKLTIADLTTPAIKQIVPAVQQIAAKPLTVTAAEKQIVISPEQLVALVVPKVIPNEIKGNRPTVTVSFDEAKLTALVNDVLSQASIEPISEVVRDGRVTRAGVAGLKAKDDNALIPVLAALVERQTGQKTTDTVAIPMVAVQAPVVYESSAPRISTGTGTGKVRLTFDDGPGAYTEQVLDILNRYNVRGTFYVVGRNAQSYPSTTKRICNEQTIGNHSFNHADLTRLSYAGVMQEIASTQNVVKDICGFAPSGFRPPYGAVNQTVREVAGSLGVSIDMWSVDPDDWGQPGSGVIARRVLSHSGPGSVILLHVLYQQSVNALPQIIEGLRAQGYTLE